LVLEVEIYLGALDETTEIGDMLKKVNSYRDPVTNDDVNDMVIEFPKAQLLNRALGRMLHTVTQGTAKSIIRTISNMQGLRM
jgi:hypothetical protein